MAYAKLSLLVLVTVIHCAMGGGEVIARRCLQVTAADLGSNVTVSSEGIISRATGFPVQINRFNILCLSSSDVVERYQSTSVLVGYFCPGCPGSGTMEEIVEQFTFDCSLVATTFTWDSSTVQRAIPMSVDFSTLLDRSCGLCEHPDRLDPGVSLSMYDQNTHCISK